MKRLLLKYQSVGNDFPILKVDPKEFSTDWSASAVQLSDRRRGVGGDGLLVTTVQDGNLHLRMFNPDGTEDFCGNGTACAVQANRDALGLAAKGSVRVHHFGQTITAESSPDSVALLMPWPSYRSADIPVRQTDGPVEIAVADTRGTPISTGTAHYVVSPDQTVDDVAFDSISRAIEVDPTFPERTSVLWPILESPNAVRLRIWERGVGETLGCGTGALAVAFELARQGHLDSSAEIKVTSRGGTLGVRIDHERRHLWLVAHPQAVFTAEIEL